MAKTILFSIVIGLLMAGLGVAFMYLMNIIGLNLYGITDSMAMLNRATSLFSGTGWLFVIMPLGGLIVGLLTYYVMPNRANVGLVPIIMGTHRKEGFVSLREGVGVGLIAATGIGTGASVGRFGPAAHLGAGVGSYIANLINVGRTGRVALIGASISSIITISFNAPLAGIFFAHEVFVRNYSMKFLLPTVLAAITAKLTNIHVFNIPAMFDAVSFTQMASASEVGLIGIIGIIGGLLAIAYVYGLTTLAPKIYGKLPVHNIAKPVIGGFVLAVIGFIAPQTLGLGAELMTQFVSTGSSAADLALWILVAVLAFKWLAIVVSFGFGFNGGIVAPALFLGASLGAIMAFIAPMFVNEAFMSTAVLSAMMAVLGATLGAPIMAIGFAVDLSASVEVIIPVALAVIIALTVKRILFANSFFHVLTGRAGLDLDKGLEDAAMQVMPLKNLIQEGLTAKSEDAIQCDQNATLDQALTQIDQHPEKEFVAVGDLGFVSVKHCLAQYRQKAQWANREERS